MMFEIILAVACWLIPGPVILEWVVVSGKKLRLRPRSAAWVAYIEKLWHRARKWRHARDQGHGEEVWFTTAHPCPGNCGCTIGSGWIRHEDDWVMYMVTPHVCEPCARHHVFRLLRAIADRRVRLLRTLRAGDILDPLEIEIDSNRIMGTNGQVAVIVDDDHSPS